MMKSTVGDTLYLYTICPILPDSSDFLPYKESLFLWLCIEPPRHAWHRLAIQHILLHGNLILSPFKFFSGSYQVIYWIILYMLLRWTCPRSSKEGMDSPDSPLDIPALGFEPNEMFTPNLCRDEVTLDPYKLILPLSTKTGDRPSEPSPFENDGTVVCSTEYAPRRTLEPKRFKKNRLEVYKALRRSKITCRGPRARAAPCNTVHIAEIRARWNNL
jgi:hypothetical protein